jgi:hypothetical protein
MIKEVWVMSEESIKQTERAANAEVELEFPDGEVIKAPRSVANVIATMQISNMYLDKDFILKLIKMQKGEMTSEELIQEVKREYSHPASEAAEDEGTKPE